MSTKFHVSNFNNLVETNCEFSGRIRNFGGRNSFFFVYKLYKKCITNNSRIRILPEQKYATLKMYNSNICFAK